MSVYSPSQAQPGPKRGILKKGFAPVTAKKCDPEAISLRREMRRNEAKDVQWESVDGNYQVPPLVDDHRSGKDILGNLKELKKRSF